MMNFTPEEHRRRSIRLKGYDYSAVGGYYRVLRKYLNRNQSFCLAFWPLEFRYLCKKQYVTIVAFRRECLFGEIVAGEMRFSSLGRIVNECWEDIPSHFPNTGTDAFVVMPNHIHGILILHENIRAEAFASDRRGTIYRAPTPTTEIFGKPTVGSLPTIVRTFKAAVTRRAGRELDSANIWQRNYFEHIIRGQIDYERIAGYILANPANWKKDEEFAPQSPLSE